jgi:hypothetical protein
MSLTSSAGRSVCSVNPSGTLQRNTSLSKQLCHSRCDVKKITLPSSEPEQISESLKGFLPHVNIYLLRAWMTAYQSVSNTTAVWPLNSGMRSGSRPLSLIGMTANAPPPLASQLTAMYSGLACTLCQIPLSPRLVSNCTLTRFVSQAFLDILRLS